MIYDLIIVEPKINKLKVAIAIIIALLVIGCCIFAGIYFAKLNKKNKINSNNIIENVQEVVIKTEKTKHIAKINFNPEFTNIGKELIDNIYDSDEKIAYLTFDDGPSKSVTPLILDLLKQENIKATFFVLGSRAKSFPDILRREYKEGHYIANHGYSHVYGDIYDNPQSVLAEYNKTRDIVREILQTDYDGHLFRFPGGLPGGKYRYVKADAKILLNENNIATIDWNALSNDAAGAKTKEAIIQNIKESVEEKNSVVILMHDAGDKILTYETLPDVISYLREKGYNFKNFYSVIK